MIVATIAQGEAGWADILFLVAVCLFAIGAAISLVARSVEGTIMASGLCAVALGWLLL